MRWALAAAMLAIAACASPRADRDWLPYLARTAHASIEADQAAISPVSDWSYTADGPASEDYRDETIRMSALRDVWFVLEPQPGSKIAAHTLLLFEFEGEALLGLTIEARRERDERYSALRGAFNAYELSYLWASARDLLTRRAVMLGHDVFVYPVAIPDENKQALLVRLLERTNALAEHPRYYNTVFSNCTNELAKAAGLKWNSAFVLTGTADDYLFRQGVIPGDDFAAAQARARLTNFIVELNDSVSPADFDHALLQRLREGETAGEIDTRPSPLVGEGDEHATSR